MPKLQLKKTGGYSLFGKGSDKVKIPEGEKECITKNRPFHVFVVKQLSYKSQYKTIAMNLDDLKMLTVVGQGAFGTVFLGKMTTTNKYYAIKMLKKNKLIDDKAIDYAKFEINVMKTMQHPYILGIDFVKQQKKFIFLMLPFAVGGDMTDLITKMKRTKPTQAVFEEKQLLFWLVQLVEGLGYLH